MCVYSMLRQSERQNCPYASSLDSFYALFDLFSDDVENKSLWKTNTIVSLSHAHTQHNHLTYPETKIFVLQITHEESVMEHLL